MEYCLDTEFTGITEALLGNLSPDIIGSIGGAASGLIDNATASRNEDPLPELFMRCGVPLVDELGNLIEGLFDAIMGVVPNLLEGCIVLNTDQIIAFLEPFYSL